MSRISQSQLESYLWGAAEHLRGSIDAGDYKQFIFPLLFLKRLCDVHDEETTAALRASGGDAEFASFAENHRFQVPAEAHWKEIRKETRNVGQVIQRAMRTIESANKDKLFGIFGDAQWTNKDRLSDETMRELVEHFSSLELTITNLPEDELGNGYEFLIKKFADDSGHTAAEFYTNRTVVHLMTEMLDVQPGESVYDPTCGSGGMLMSCVAHLRKQGKEWRNVRLFGQERNLMTSSIARMNCFLHGIEDFRIERGDTLAEPKLVEGDKLMQFDVVLANPPYSIKQWDREAFRSDPWGRNLFGVPPQGRADYAFQQHIIKSLKSKTGRSVALWPHGVLFRKEEDDIRQKLIESDLIEAVIGLGHNLFYNSAMQSCLLIVRANKEKSRKGKILFIDASNEVTDERAQSFLSTSNRDKILKAYLGYEEIGGFSSIATIDQVRGLDYNLNIPLYVRPVSAARVSTQSSESSLSQDLKDWHSTSLKCKSALEKELPGFAQIKPLALSTPSEIPNWVDKSKWKRVKLGDICEEVSERIDNPSGGPALRFVGLEHLDSGELKVRRWGTTENLESAMKVFKSGDILFARRNAYLKRASLADFNGVCSGDAIVLRENHAKLAPGFLALVLNTGNFWEFAVANAAGTMSRRVNGKTLANYEFNLPPLDQQRRIAQILLLTEVAMRNLQALNEKVVVFKKRSTDSCFSFLLDSAVIAQGENKCAGVELLSVSDVLLDKKSLTYGILQPGSDVAGGVPMLRAIDIEDGKLYGTHILRVAPSIESKYARTRLRGGEVLVSVMGTIGRAILVKEEWSNWNVNRALAVVRLGSKVSPHFFYYWLQSPKVQTLLSKDSIGTAQLRINLTDFKKYKLPVPSIEEQLKTIAGIASHEALQDCVAANLSSLARLRRTLLETILNYPL